ncbi:hypothetical protein RM863_02805 [Streptomyces sp. DSM 41014]|uniref:Uncharacterized protein n=1 Tax=Streptomyces hintoniae TaxID=3075521 RepID=A0ABU2UCT2_9ACTN|nr:hypothetical protein [Streptomyces sp. DSM 41014]MDT0471068.1 hypothetical protein [Streptomyces sp. DSM 41014]
MSLRSLQNVLFKIYLSPGYLLAHQFDPDRFSAGFGLSGEDAAIVRNLPPRETEEFARELKAKQLSNLRYQLPMTYGWLTENRAEVLRGFEDISILSRLAKRGALAELFVDYVREWRDYADLPDALPEVARLEYLLMSARRDQDEMQRRQSKSAVSQAQPDRFSWDSVYWLKPRTVVAKFSVDALSVLLKRKEMGDAGSSIGVVISPTAAGHVPTVMRIAEPAYALLRGMDEPRRARDLRENALDAGRKIDDHSLRKLLSTLENVQVVGALHRADSDGQ